MIHTQEWTNGYNAAVADMRSAVNGLAPVKHESSTDRCTAAVLSLIDTQRPGRTHNEYERLASKRGIAKHSRFNTVWVELRRLGLIELAGDDTGSSRNARWVQSSPHNQRTTKPETPTDSSAEAISN